MGRWALGFFVVLVLTRSVPGFAQQPAGPATLEGLLNSDEAQKAAAAANADAEPKRPAGTVARPQNGVQHPSVDKAWAAYDAAIAKVTEQIRVAINKQFDTATANGDLDTAEKWQVVMDKFEKVGELPTESETKAALTTALADYKQAREELANAYDSVVKALTIEKKVAEAREVRDEWLSITTSNDSDVNSTVSTSRPLSQIPREAVRFKGHAYYYFDSMRLGQREAAAKCLELGGYLVQIENAAEGKFIANYLMQVVAKKGLQQQLVVWIDGSDSASEGQWLLSNGTPLPYLAFAPQEPSGGTRENGAAIKVNKGAVLMHDYPQTKTFGFVCEWEAQGRQ